MTDKNKKNWWQRNCQKPDGRLDTSRVMKLTSLIALGAFLFFISTILIKMSIVFIVQHKLLISSEDLGKLAIAGGTIVGSIILPMIDYRIKDYVEKKNGGSE